MSKRARSSSPERPAGGFPWADLLPELQAMVRAITPYCDDVCLAATCKAEASVAKLVRNKAGHYSLLLVHLMMYGTVAQAQMYERMRSATYRDGKYVPDMEYYYARIYPGPAVSSSLVWLKEAVSANNLPMLKWLHANTSLLRGKGQMARLQRYAVAVAEKEHLDLLAWTCEMGRNHRFLEDIGIHPHYSGGSSALVTCAVLFSNGVVLRWLYANGWTFGDESVVRAAVAVAMRSGDLSCLEWLISTAECVVHARDFHALSTFADPARFDAEVATYTLEITGQPPDADDDIPRNTRVVAKWLVQHLVSYDHAPYREAVANETLDAFVAQMLDDPTVAARYLKPPPGRGCPHCQ